MKRQLWFWTVAAGVAVAWLLLKELHWAARLWTAFLLVPLPVLAMAQLPPIEEAGELPRVPVYVSSTFSLWILTLLTAVAVRVAGISAADIGVVVPSLTTLLVWAGGLTAVGLAVILAAAAVGIRESAILRQILPVNGREKAYFAGLSLTAGFCEELVFRGFLLFAVTVASGSIAIGAIVATAVFGLMHAYQDPMGALRASLLGVVLLIPVVVTGSVVPSMVAHAAIDLIAGILLKDYLVRQP